MPVMPCLRCGRLTRGSYCPEHKPKPHVLRPSPSSRDRPSPALRRKVKARDGGRCVRCGSTECLEVHHSRRAADGGSHDMTNLVTMCAERHGAITRSGVAEPQS